MTEPARPEVLVVVAGVATEVGKTWVGARLLAHLRQAGGTVAARKPVQSFDPDEPGPLDAEVLAGATGEDAATVCPPHRAYPLAMAPPMAADALGQPAIALADLLAETTWPAGVEVGLLETVGGVRSPLAHDGDSADLARRVAPDLVVLVADAGLGTINAVRLSVAALAPLPVLVVLNRYDGSDLHARNRAWLAADGHRLVTDVAELADAILALGR